MSMLVMRALGGVAVAVTLAALGSAQAGAAAKIPPVPSARPLIVSHRGAAHRMAMPIGPDNAAASGGAWDKAIEVPGTASLNVGGVAAVESVSCTSRDYCAAAGDYGSSPDDRDVTRVFVVSRWRGRWGKAGQVPGLASFGGGGAAVSSQADAVSCASPGNCAVGGSFVDQYGDPEGFVASERNGKWDNAIRATGSLLSAGPSEVYSVSCPSAGDCEAVGYYFDGGVSISDSEAFVVSEQNGRWGQAIEIPGLAALNVDNRARAYSISCPSAGNCVVGGFYLDADGRWQAFVASQRHSRWSPAIEVPGTAAANVGGQANVDSVSCSSPGNCAAGGYYEASAYNGDTATWQAFVVSQRDGTWGTAVPVLRTASVNDNTVGAATESVSCPSRSDCAAAGAYIDRAGQVQAFTVGQRDGRWGKAVEVRGTSALNRGGDAQVFSVSCQSAGNCNAGGFYVDGRGHAQAFGATERNGRWGNAVKMPGTATLNAGGNAALLSVSCPAAGRCGGGGYYNDSSHLQAFVASRAQPRR
jgi:hypothetical protein